MAVDSKGNYKKGARRAKTEGEKPGFKTQSRDGKMVKKYLQQHKGSEAKTTPKELKKKFPQLEEYKSSSFSACLRLMKTAIGFHARAGK